MNEVHVLVSDTGRGEDMLVHGVYGDKASASQAEEGIPDRDRFTKIWNVEFRYSHRNGETDPPEVEGWYWAVTPDAKFPIECHLMGTSKDDIYPGLIAEGYLYSPPDGVRFYGPIPTPHVNMKGDDDTGYRDPRWGPDETDYSHPRWDT